uniref:Uncharacterized protein n=1 Tax=mine drainage metagenome TaxID=410659 RepID=E6QQI9_9ZZZZ
MDDSEASWIQVSGAYKYFSLAKNVESR